MSKNLTEALQYVGIYNQ